MIKPELIIFDCDGVLVDSEVLSCGCLSEALAACGIALGADQALELFLGRGAAAVAEYFAARGQPVPAGFREDYARRVKTAFAADLRPIAGVATVLRALRIPFCLASSSDLDRIALSLALTGLAGYFGDRVFSSQMVKRGKPAPDLFLHAAATMEVDPRQVLVIEDSVSGVLAARAAGMAVWGFTGGSHYASRDGRAQLAEAGADPVFATMTELWAGELAEANGHR